MSALETCLCGLRGLTVAPIRIHLHKGKFWHYRAADNGTCRGSAATRATQAETAGKSLRIKSAVGCAMRVGVERDIGDGNNRSGEPIARLEVTFHDAQSGVSFRVPFRDEVPFLFQFLWRRECQPVARHRDVRLVAVLLEEHPLQHLRAVPFIAGLQFCSFAQVEKDSAGFRQAAPRLRIREAERVRLDELEERRLARRAVMQR